MLEIIIIILPYMLGHCCTFPVIETPYHIITIPSHIHLGDVEQWFEFSDQGPLVSRHLFSVELFERVDRLSGNH